MIRIYLAWLIGLPCCFLGERATRRWEQWYFRVELNRALAKARALRKVRR